jgi:beta-glucanase (GH16 family)
VLLQRILLGAACAAVLACLGAVPAVAAPSLTIQPAPHGQVKAGIAGAVSSGRLVYVLDGHRVSRTRRHAIVLPVPAHRGRAAVWHRLQVKRVGSTVVLAAARFALGSRSSRRTPTLVLLGAPPAQTGASSAVLRFAATTKNIACSRDGSAFQRCASPMTFSGLSPRAHRFTIRAGKRRTSSVSVTSDVLAQPVAPQPVAAQPPASSTPPGPQPDVPGAAGRQLLFEDDFDGTQLDTASWSAYNGSGYGGHGLRRPSAVSLDGQGDLVISAQTIDGTVTSGGMANRLNRAYGLYVFRVRTDPDPTRNMSGAVLTWPQSGVWPQDGENDIYETGTYYPRDPFYSFIHFGSTATTQHSFKQFADANDWHTMAMDWSESAIKIYRDGALVWTMTDPAAIAHVPHHLCIQLDALGSGQLTGPVRMYVDWVRIYQ